MGDFALPPLASVCNKLSQTTRSLELTYMQMLVKHSTTKEFRVLMGLASASTFPNISHARVKHFIIEMYDANKKVRRRDWRIFTNLR